jgi:ABC-2 type transport system ATP-binding protein
MQLTVREFVRRYNQRFGATVLLTSHYMDDVAALCPRVIVIDKGSLRYDGGLAELVRTIRPEKRIVVGFDRSVERADLDPFGRVVDATDGKAVIQVRKGEVRASVARILEKFPVVDLTIEDPPLEEVVRELFAGAKAEAGAGPEPAK